MRCATGSSRSSPCSDSSSACCSGGAAVTEAVFAYPGMGQLLVNAINVQDFPTIEAAILVLAGVYIVVNLLADILYAIADPRLRR